MADQVTPAATGSVVRRAVSADFCLPHLIRRLIRDESPLPSPKKKQMMALRQTVWWIWRRRDALPFPSRAVYMPMPSCSEPDRAKERLQLK